MKVNLYDKILTYDFKSLFEKKGYAFFTKGVYNVNIIGIRSNKDNKVTDKFDDYLVIDYDTNNCHKRQIFTITTEPGRYYVKNPINSKGTAILVPGQYRGAYAIDLHRGKYQALCQRHKSVKVYRDGNKDDIYDMLPEKIETGMFGINIHRSNEYKIATNINSYSAGCQVFNDPKEFNAFMRVCKEAKKIWGNKFTYTLLDEKDLI